MIFQFPAIFLLILETKAHFKMVYFLKQLSFFKSVFHICFYLVTHFERHAISWNLNLAVNLVTSFSHQKQLKSKNNKHAIV